MFIISTKYLGATQTKGSRIKVTNHWTKETRTYPYDYSATYVDRGAVLRYIEESYDESTLGLFHIEDIRQGGRLDADTILWIVPLNVWDSIEAKRQTDEIKANRRQIVRA